MLAHQFFSHAGAMGRELFRFRGIFASRRNAETVSQAKIAWDDIRSILVDLGPVAKYPSLTKFSGLKHPATLRHLIPASFFHPGSSPSSLNKRSPPPGTVKVSSPPPIPPPKPSKLRVVGSAGERFQTRSAHSSGSEHTSNGFGQNVVENSATVTVDYNPAGFRFPQQFRIQSEPPPSKHSQPGTSPET